MKNYLAHALILALALPGCAMTQTQHLASVLNMLEGSRGLECEKLQQYIDIGIKDIKERLK